MYFRYFVSLTIIGKRYKQLPPWAWIDPYRDHNSTAKTGHGASRTHDANDGFSSQGQGQGQGMAGGCGTGGDGDYQLGDSLVALEGLLVMCVCKCVYAMRSP
jgi:hypothetical protein